MAELQFKDIKDSSFPFRTTAEPCARAPNQKQQVPIKQTNGHCSEEQRLSQAAPGQTPVCISLLSPATYSMGLRE